MLSPCLASGSKWLRWFGKCFFSFFAVLFLSFQTYAQCSAPVLVKATQTAAEGKIALIVSGGVPFEAKHTPETFYQYRWTDNSGKLFSRQKDVSGLAPGTYRVEVTDDSECKVVNTYTLKGLPKISLSTEKLDFTASVNKSISQFFTITNTGNDDLKITKITLPAGVFTTDWIETTLPAGASKKIKVTFSPLAVKEYKVELRVESNTKEGIHRLSLLARGVSSPESGLTLFPNPVADVLHFGLSGMTTPVDIQLTDVNGQVLYQQVKVKEDRVSLDVSGYQEGVYLLRFYGGEPIKFKEIRKVIIRR